MNNEFNPKVELEETYHALCEAFGVTKSGWDMIHCNYSPYMFCKENRVSIIGEYLTWKWFVQLANDYGVIYYHGIDDFLTAYKNAVESRVNID